MFVGNQRQFHVLMLAKIPQCSGICGSDLPHLGPKIPHCLDMWLEFIALPSCDLLGNVLCMGFEGSMFHEFINS